MSERNVPGAFVALLKNEEVVYQRHFGYSDLANKVPVTGQTGFNIGSISKTFTAWGIMKLVEQGKIGLDSAASKYLTRWQFPESKYDIEEVTIRKILSHTAGLSVHGYPGWSRVEKLPTIEESLSGIPKKSTRVKLAIKPGTKFKYSGGGFSVLQLIIEEVTGDTFEHYMDTAIVAPLGLNNSSFNIDNRILSKSSLEYNKKGKQIPFEHFTAKAAAGFHTCPDDLIKFIQMHFSTLNKNSNSSTVISASSIKEMLTVVPRVEDKTPTGLGYFRYIKSWGHSGANSGWMAQIVVNTESNSGLVVLTNSYSGHRVMSFVIDQWNTWLTE